MPKAWDCRPSKPDPKGYGPRPSGRSRPLRDAQTTGLRADGAVRRSLQLRPACGTPPLGDVFPVFHEAAHAPAEPRADQRVVGADLRCSFLAARADAIVRFAHISWSLSQSGEDASKRPSKNASSNHGEPSQRQRRAGYMGRSCPVTPPSVAGTPSARPPLRFASTPPRKALIIVLLMISPFPGGTRRGRGVAVGMASAAGTSGAHATRR